MRGSGVLIVGSIVVGAYLLGAKQNDTRPASTQPLLRPPTQLVTIPNQATRSPAPSKLQAGSPDATMPISLAPPRPTEPSKASPSTQQKATTALTAAAIAALIVVASRQAYYATGRPCACPDDRMKNGRSCGSRSAYSRPGGAQPLCFPHDVTAQMIETYRSRSARR